MRYITLLILICTTALYGYGQPVKTGPPYPETLVKVETPASTVEKVTPTDSIMAISIFENEIKLTVDKGEHTFKDAVGLGKFLDKKSPKGYTITLKADKGLAYTKVERVINVLRYHSVNTFSLITNPQY